MENKNPWSAKSKQYLFTYELMNKRVDFLNIWLENTKNRIAKFQILLIISKIFDQNNRLLTIITISSKPIESMKLNK